MRLCYLGSEYEFATALREDWYTEWSIGFGRGVLLRAGRPLASSDPAIALEIPDVVLERYARGAAWPSECLVPAAIVNAHDPASKVSSDC